MKRILFSLGLFLALVGNQVYADRSFYAESVKATYYDCTKAIEKGVPIAVDPSYTIFYYKDRMYTIVPRDTDMYCSVREFK